VRTVRFVKQAQELGFSLAEIDILLHLGGGGPDSCHTTRELAAAKITRLDAKVAALQSMRASLARLASTCDRPTPERDCPLLHSLQRPADPDPSRRACDSHARLRSTTQRRGNTTKPRVPGGRETISMRNPAASSGRPGDDLDAKPQMFCGPWSWMLALVTSAVNNIRRNRLRRCVYGR
jgi:hypothetical protein